MREPRTDTERWAVVVDGEVVHEADERSEAQRWANERGITPDKIAPVSRPLMLLPNWKRRLPYM